MKKLFTGIVILCAVNLVHAQGINGSWRGALVVPGQTVHLIFNIKSIADTSYEATFDSPDQKAFGIPCSKTWVKKDSVFMQIAANNIMYEGLRHGNDSISGIYKQGGGRFPLNLKRMPRPQTPKPPFSYYSQDVEYDNAGKTLHYGATFTRPNGKGKYPAVIIITGSGKQDRDGTLFGHELYWVLADYLTRQGIAVLRVDDRGAGKSTVGPDAANVTSADFSNDVENSLNYLETRTDVDKKHLGLIGHSEGGIIAPMVAARRKDVSFIVLWGAPEIGGAKINTDQNAYALKSAGIDSTAIAAFKTLHSQVLGLFTKATSKDNLDTLIAPCFNSWKQIQTKKTLDALYVHDNSILGMDVFTMYNGLYNLPWMRFFITYKPETDLSKVTCPVLAVNGSKDTQVNPAENLSAIKAILSQSGNKDFKVIELPGLNHLLQHAKTGDDAEYGEIEETMSPEALNIISNWIKLHTK